MSDLSPSQVIFETLEQLQDSEASEVIVIWKDEKGNLNWNSTSKDFPTKLGMIEFCKFALLEQSRESQK